MRIAMLTWESLHSIAVGGVAAHVSELAEAMAQAGEEVHVFTRSAPDQSPYEFIDGVHYHRCTYPPCDDFVDDVNAMCRAITQQVFETEDHIGPFDVVHAHDWLTANAMIWIKQARGRRSMLTIHSTEYARCGNSFPDGIARRIREQERAGTYWADRVIAVSTATKDEICWMYEVPNWKTAVLFNGVKRERFDTKDESRCAALREQYNIGKNEPTVLFCGRLAHQKGPDLMLEAMPDVLATRPNTKFIIAGDGDMRTRLEQRARELNIQHAVRVLGYRNGNELPQLFHLADAVCVPSRNEPFGIVVLEAWSASKPVVVTHVGGPAEYVDHEQTGLKVFPTVDSVAWGLKTMLNDLKRGNEMGQRGRLLVEANFGWDVTAQKTLCLYDPDRPYPETAVTESTTEAVAQIAEPKPEPVQTTGYALSEPAPVNGSNGHADSIEHALRTLVVDSVERLEDDWFNENELAEDGGSEARALRFVAEVTLRPMRQWRNGAANGHGPAPSNHRRIDVRRERRAADAVEHRHAPARHPEQTGTSKGRHATRRCAQSTHTASHKPAAPALAATDAE